MISEPPKPDEMWKITLYDKEAVNETAEENCPRCFNCRFYAPLARPTGPDFGVCCNEESFDSGNLMFKDLGCWQHKKRNHKLWPKEKVKT